MKLRVFEAFAGYGSQSIALGLLSESFPDFQFQTIGISEIDKYAITAYYTLHGSSIPNYGDITKIDWSQVADFDLLTYSFPCQDISSAGKQRGFSEGSGTRSSCLWACANAIEKKRPKFLLMENVKALTQKKFSADFRRWREWLIKQGYTNYYAVVNAKDYGVPQNRERVFMVSFLGEHSAYSFPKPFELTRRLKHVLEDEVEEKYWLKPEQIRAMIELGSDIANALTSVQKDSMVAVPRVIQVGNLIEESNYKNPHCGRVYSIEGIAPCLNCNEGGQRVVKVVIPNTDRVIQVGNIREKDNGFNNPQRGRVYSAEGIAPTLMSNNQGGGRKVKILQCGHGFAKGGVYDIAPAITSSKWQDNHFALIEYWIRKLTPRECFRLMDVPEHYIDRLLSAGISNSQLYKLAGNSIVVAVLYHIFRKMFTETAKEYGAPVALRSETPAQLSLF